MNGKKKSEDTQLILEETVKKYSKGKWNIWLTKERI